MATSQKFSEFLSKITVEPLTLLYIFGMFIAQPAYHTFIYLRTCSSLFPNDTSICVNLHNKTYSEEEAVVHRAVAHFNLLNFYFYSIPPFVMIIVYGVISDRYNRKLVVSIPLVGTAISNIIIIILATQPSVHINLQFLGSFMSGLSGGWTTFFMAISSYVTQVTTEQERTSRLSISNAMYAVALSLSQFLGGVISANTSFLFIFSLSAGLNGLALLYTIFVLKNIKNTTVINNHTEASQTYDRGDSMAETTNNNIKGAKKKQCNYLRTLKKNLKDLFKVRPHNGRCRLIILILIMFLVYYANAPMFNLIFLYTKQQPLSFSQTLFGYYQGYTYGIKAIWMLVALPIMKHFRVRDTVIMTVSILSAMASQVMIGFSKTVWLIFLSTLVGSFMEGIYVAPRSMISVILDKNQIGQVFAFVGTLQSFGEFASSAMYTSIYGATLDFWPGFVFILAGSLFILPFIASIWLYNDYKTNLRETSNGAIMMQQVESTERQEYPDEEANETTHSLLSDVVGRQENAGSAHNNGIAGNSHNNRQIQDAE